MVTQHKYHFQRGRRALLAVVLIGIIALALTVGRSLLPSKDNPSPAVKSATTNVPIPRHTMPKSAGLYVPTGLQTGQYDQTAQLPLDQVDRIYIAFALPDTTGSLNVPSFDPLAPVLNKLTSNNEVMLSIGGYGDTQSRPAIMTGWQAALDHPQQFAQATSAAIAQLQQKTTAKVGVDLDFEYPTGKQAKDFLTLVQAIRQTLPDAPLTMAVPAHGYTTNDSLKGYDFGKKGLQTLVDQFNVMAYDQNVKSGPVTSAAWTASAVTDWVRRIGDASRITVGFPAYGYRFHDGQNIAITYDKIPVDTIHDDLRNGTSEAQLDGDLISCLSPAVIINTSAQLHAKYPNLGGVFYWSTQGLTVDHLNAIQSLR